MTSFLREVCALELPGSFADRHRAYQETTLNAAWWYAHRKFLVVSERPSEIHLQHVQPGARRGGKVSRLHSGDGRALAWADGWAIYALHGRQVPGWIVERPSDICVAHIEAETNSEVRRVMLELYGPARYLADSGARVVDEIPAKHPILGLRGARLLRRDLAGRSEPIVYLEMLNSTADPDGSRRRYLERIDPRVYSGDAGRLCHAAMASRWLHRDEEGRLQRTFEHWQDYQPQAES